MASTARGPGASSPSQRRTELTRRLREARREDLLARNVPLAKIVMDLPALKRMGLSNGLFFLRTHWPHIAGQPLALHTTPWSLKDGVLTVKADSPLYRQELTYAVGRIVRIAQDHLGADAVLSVKAARN
jgi:predicted nucleic acid-binding Zn ribbon protein